MLAAIQAPVIMMSQNRQDTKDRLRGELDYDVNRRAATDIQGLARKINALCERVGDLQDTLERPAGATVARTTSPHASDSPRSADSGGA
jgi:CRP/FNR family cyclic AMP-dependent transcriptional regulator